MEHDLAQGKNGWVGRPTPAWPATGSRAAYLRDLVETVRARGGGRLELWIEAATDADDGEVLAAGFTTWRELWQMRCPLPAAAPDPAFTVRAFTDRDADDFIRVNARAFAWHPEQGKLTLADLRAAQTEPWFRADGFLLHERDGRLAAFCWTKIHPADPAAGEPALGEIYAIAVDPDFHGRRMGLPMTLAGLDWLARQGLRVGMLYVEHDNAPAVRVYEQIGFTVHHADRAYEMNVVP